MKSLLKTLTEKLSAIKNKIFDSQQKEPIDEIILFPFEEYDEDLKSNDSPDNSMMYIDAEIKKTNISDIKILVHGASFLKSTDLQRVFNKIFFDSFSCYPNRKAIEAECLKYEDCKNSNINSKIKKDRYDYVIIGPMAHSTKGKRINQCFEEYGKEYNLKAEFFRSSKKINKSYFEGVVADIIEDWKTKSKVKNEVKVEEIELTAVLSFQ